VSRPDFPFNVMVTQDVIFPGPYQKSIKAPVDRTPVSRHNPRSPPVPSWSPQYRSIDGIKAPVDRTPLPGSSRPSRDLGNRWLPPPRIQHFGLELTEVDATNVFPFVKVGSMSIPIRKRGSRPRRAGVRASSDRDCSAPAGGVPGQGGIRCGGGCCRSP